MLAEELDLPSEVRITTGYLSNGDGTQTPVTVTEVRFESPITINSGESVSIATTLPNRNGP